MIEANIMTEQQGSISDVKIVSTNNAKIDNALDLNPTAFIDDLYNAVGRNMVKDFVGND